jgi:hypothetical protein
MELLNRKNFLVHVNTYNGLSIKNIVLEWISYDWLTARTRYGMLVTWLPIVFVRLIQSQSTFTASMATEIRYGHSTATNLPYFFSHSYEIRSMYPYNTLMDPW